MTDHRPLRQPMTRPMTRRAVGRALLGGALALAASRARVASADQPTGGCGRPGPSCAVAPHRTARGPKPVTISVPKADVDAPVEVSEIIDGQMQNPSGPFVVAWYRESGRLGEADNIVMAGHLDYWSVGQAVFYHLGGLKAGDAIEVTGDDNHPYRYSVEWVRTIEVAKAGPDVIRQVVGKTADERLTLITCGGDFDYKRGEYKERTVVRAIPQPAG